MDWCQRHHTGFPPYHCNIWQQLILFAEIYKERISPSILILDSEPPEGSDLSLRAFKVSMKESTELFLGTSVEREEEGRWRPWRPEVPHALLHTLCPGPTLCVVLVCARQPLLMFAPVHLFFCVISNLLLRKNSQQDHVSCTIPKVINHPRWSRPERVEPRLPRPGWIDFPSESNRTCWRYWVLWRVVSVLRSTNKTPPFSYCKHSICLKKFFFIKYRQAKK